MALCRVDTTAPELDGDRQRRGDALGLAHRLVRWRGRHGKHVPRIVVDWTNGIVGNAYLDCEAFSAVQCCA